MEQVENVFHEFPLVKSAFVEVGASLRVNHLSGLDAEAYLR